MDAKTFFDNFGLIASAPNGVEQLRGMILQLAVQGKLTNTSSTPEIVKLLLDEAVRQKYVYQDQYKIKRSKPLPCISSIEIPFEIPSHWQWERLDNIAIYIQRGKSPRYDDLNKKAYVASQKCVQWSGFSLKEARGVDEVSLETYAEDRFLKRHDLLWNSTGGGTVGRICLFDGAERVVADSHITVIRLSNFNSKYIWYFFASPTIQERFDSTHPMTLVAGTTNQLELATKAVKSLAIPCPPRQEQDQIVVTVERLLAICDRLGALNNKRENLQTRVNQAMFLAMAKAEDKAEFQKAWGRFYQNYQYCFESKNSINDLKHLMRYLHVRGIAQANVELTKPLGIADKSVSIPDSWHWAKIADVKEYITSGSRNWKKYYATMGDIFIQSQDIKYDRLEFSQKNFVNLPIDVEGKRTLTQENDLLVTITGANVGRCAVMPKLDDNAYVSQHIALIRLKEPEIASFLHLWITNNYGGKYLLLGMSYGDKPGLNLKQIAMLPVPLPPSKDIAEQIVIAVRRLEVICTQLEFLTNKRTKLASKLLESSIKAMTGMAALRRKIMKAPKTEIITELSIKHAPSDSTAAPLYALLQQEGGKLTAKALWQTSTFDDINQFYQQLRTEIHNGWIEQGELTVHVEKTEDNA